MDNDVRLKDRIASPLREAASDLCHTHSILDFTAFQVCEFFCLFVGSCDFMIPLLSNHYPLKYLMCSDLFLLWLQATTSLQVPNIS